jgi:hypothetical protein
MTALRTLAESSRMFEQKNPVAYSTRTALGEIGRIRTFARDNNNIRVEVTHPPRQRENSAHDPGGDRDDAEHKEDWRGTVCAVGGGPGGAGS